MIRFIIQALVTMAGLWLSAGIVPAWISPAPGR